MRATISSFSCKIHIFKPFTSTHLPLSLKHLVQFPTKSSIGREIFPRYFSGEYVVRYLKRNPIYFGSKIIKHRDINFMGFYCPEEIQIYWRSWLWIKLYAVFLTLYYIRVPVSCLLTHYYLCCWGNNFCPIHKSIKVDA